MSGGDGENFVLIHLRGVGGGVIIHLNFKLRPKQVLLTYILLCISISNTPKNIHVKMGMMFIVYNTL